MQRGFVDERGAVLAAVTARLDGKDDSYRHAHLWTIRDGRVTSFEEFPDEGRSQDLLLEQSAPAVCSRGRAPSVRRRARLGEAPRIDSRRPGGHVDADRVARALGGTVDAPAPTLIAINHVRADRADDFEEWLRTVVAPVMRQHRPEQDGRWSVVRAEQAEDGVVTFAFLFSGGPAEDWELHPLLEEALGPAGADDALRQMSDMLERDQYGWSVAPVRL